MDYVLRAIIVIVLLFVVLPFFVDPNFNPLYVGNRNNARSASCQSNMKQIGIALTQYSQDYDETMPATAADGRGWRESIYPYVKSTGVYRCPDDKRDGSHDSPANLPKSYGANAAVLTSSTKIMALTEPTQTITVVDSRGYNGEEWNMVSPAFLPSGGRELYAHLPRHLFYERPIGKLNLLFADGHVKRLAPMATLSPVNLWTWDNKPFAGRIW